MPNLHCGFQAPMSRDTRAGRILALWLVFLMVMSPVASAASVGGVALQQGAGNETATPTDTPQETPTPTDTPTETPTETTTTDEQRERGGDVLSGNVQRRLEQAEQGEQVPIIVLFRTQPEDRIQADRLSAAEVRTEAKALAEDTQGPTLRYLEQQQQRGKATDINSFYLRNAIAIKADADVIQELSNSGVVDRIIVDSQVSAADNEGPDWFRQWVDEVGEVAANPTGFERRTSGQRVNGIEAINAGAVQDAGITGEGVKVSVIDTGINDSHPALQGQVVRRQNFVNESNATGDPDGHGTHVAAIVAGRSDAQNAVGVAPGANLFDARALGEFGSGNLSDIIDAFEWSAENNADIASASLGMPPIHDTQETTGLQIGNNLTKSTSFEIFTNQSEGFRPAYMLVRVSSIDPSGGTASAAADNLSITVEDPSGNTPLQQFSAGFLFESGEVPDDILFSKFKPANPQQLENGNYSVNITNSNEVNVTADIEVVVFYPPDGTGTLSQTVDTVADAGTVPVVAAGNDGGMLGNQSINSPAAAEGAIAVGATGENTTDVTSFSSRGPVGFGSDARPGVDIVAPGENILSAASPEVEPGEEPYVQISGTSQATPHVSGTIALMLEANPEQFRNDESDPDQPAIETTLDTTAQPIPPRGENEVGAGAVDAYAAVNSTVAGTLGANQQRQSGVQELFAGLGNTGEDRVFVSFDPVNDPVGDAGTAPDIEAAFAEINDFDATFQVGLADDTPANTTFETYINADKNATTGDPANNGAEYRLTFERTLSGGSYTGDISIDEYNPSTQAYEPAGRLDAFSNEVSANYVKYAIETDLGADDGLNTTEFNWHIVSTDPDSDSTDRLPDTGQADARYPVSIDGKAVAWNATAGEPAEAAVEFRLFTRRSDIDLAGTPANRTVQTNVRGLAETTFEAESGGDSDFILEVEDERGNQIRQEYEVFEPVLEDRFQDSSRDQTRDNLVVDDRNYRIRADDAVEVNIPVYFANGTEITPYEGPASLAFEEFGFEAAIVNNISVDDGVVTATVSAEEIAVERRDALVDIRLALTSNYSNAQETFSAGNIDVKDRVVVETRVTPDTQVVQPQTSTSLTFQTVERRDATGGSSRTQSPKNVPVEYEVTWLTDRVTADFYRNLPDGVATKLQQQRNGADITISQSERKQIQAAIQNISTQDTTPTTVQDTVVPSQRGVGQFDVTPPEDTRIGFVSAQANDSSLNPTVNESLDVDSDEAVVFVDQRIDEFRRTPTAPTDEEFNLRVRGNWPTVTQGDQRVPAENIDVTVELRNSQTDQPVDSNVTLYTTGGDSIVVSTGANGVVETEVPAPNLDYENRAFDFRRQQVLGVAQGIQNDNGRAVADRDRVFGFVSSEGAAVDNDVFVNPELTYDASNETLGLEVVYRNASTVELTNATTTLTKVGTPSTFNSQRDVFVEYIGGDTDATTLSREFNESTGPGRAEFIARTTTGNEFLGSGSTAVSGVQTDILSPSRIAAGSSANIAVRLTNSTGEPVPNATAVLYYTEVDSQGTETAAGNAFIGTTDQNGTAEFTISPDLADRFDTGQLRLRAGFATDDLAASRDGFGSIQVVSEANITGEVRNPDASPAASRNIRVDSGFESDVIQQTTTDDAGQYSITVPQGESYAVAFTQTSAATTDGVPDFYSFAATDTVDSDVALGTTTLPSGNSVEIQVVDDAGNPVPDARVRIISYGARDFNSAGVRAQLLTNDQGRITTADSGIELADNVSISVTRPEGADEFADERLTRQLDVTENQSLQFTLQGQSNQTGDDTTPPTVSVQAPETVGLNEVFTIDASGSFDAGGIANFTFALPNGTTETQTEPRLDVTLSETGQQNITVTVTDTSGNQNSTTVAVTVVEGADLTSEVSVANEQRLQDTVTANVTISNVGNADIDGTFNVRVNATGEQQSTVRQFDIDQLAAGASETQEIDITGFAQENTVTGDVEITAVADPSGTTSDVDPSNNVGSAVTEVTFSDINAQLFVPDRAVKDADTTVFVLFRNEGTAESDELTATLTGTPSDQTLTVPSLAPGDVNTTRIETTAQNTTFTVEVEGDQLFPSNNESSEELSVQPYSLSVDSVRNADTVEAGSTIYIRASVSANIPREVNATLQAPDNVTVLDDESKDVIVRGQSSVAWEIRADSAIPSDTVKQFNVTAENFGQTASKTTTIQVVTPKLKVSDQNATVINANETTGSALVTIRNETTFEQELTVDVQSGTDGRTLKGLDYLVRYPYGCVEQTTSPLLTALNTDQYYRGTSIDYDEERVNNSIAGVERLADGGANAQHENGAYSMYGNDPDGDLFYTVYALYGSSEVANDPVQSNRTEVSDNLSTINQTAAVEFLNTQQSADGSFAANHYYDDRQSMTGLTLVSLEEADRAGADTAEVNKVRADAVNYLLDQQNADGSWDDTSGESAMATALAVRGLATVTDEEVDGINQTAVDQALTAGTNYLAAEQNDQGAWGAYHDTSSFNRQGTVSETTAHAVLALNASGIDNQNETVKLARNYLQGVYQQDGSWGYTRATAIAIDALQTVTTQGAAQQNVTVTINNDEGTEVFNQTITVGGDQSVKTIELTDADNQTLQDLRAGDAGPREVTVQTEGDGLVVVSIENSQVVNEREFEEGGA